MRVPGEPAQAVKPQLRGWLHLGTFPLVLVAGMLLVALGPAPEARLCAVVYALTVAAYVLQYIAVSVVICRTGALWPPVPSLRGRRGRRR